MKGLYQRRLTQAQPVHDAADQGQLECLKILAVHGADCKFIHTVSHAHRAPCVVTAADSEGYTARRLAQEDGQAECAIFLARAIGRKERGEPVLGEETIATLVPSSPAKAPDSMETVFQEPEVMRIPSPDAGRPTSTQRPESSMSGREEEVGC